MIFLALFVWIMVCIIAILLSAIAHRELNFYLVDNMVSKALLLWITSLVILDIGVILVGVIIGYNPFFLGLVTILVIQAMYIMPGIFFYIKFRVEGDRFNLISAKKRLRFVVHQAIFLATFILTISFGIESEVIIFLLAFAISGVMWLFDKVFTRVLKT